MNADLTDWLAAVHAADEQAAREASGRAADWHVEEGRFETWDSPHRDPAVIAGGKPILTEDVEYSRGFAVEHIARHDPQATLARIEAERMLVALHPCEWYEVPDADGGIPWNAYKCTRCDGLADSEDGWPCQTLRALAWGYRHREGFDPAWAPEGVEVGA